MSYATLEELKTAMAISDTIADGPLQQALDAATGFIDQWCGRTFGLDTTDQTKTYEPVVAGSVDVVDLVTVTSVKLDTNGDRTFVTTLAPSDYQLLPLDGPPYQQIESWPTSSWYLGPGHQVRVVGKFGFTENGGVPPTVQQACLILAERFYKRREAPFGVLQSPELAVFQMIPRVIMDPDVIGLLTPYANAGSSARGWVVV